MLKIAFFKNNKPEINVQVFLKAIAYHSKNCCKNKCYYYVYKDEIHNTRYYTVYRILPFYFIIDKHKFNIKKFNHIEMCIYHFYFDSTNIVNINYGLYKPLAIVFSNFYSIFLL